MSSEGEESSPERRPLEVVVSTGGLDRQKTCPMYVRLFCRMHGHHRLEEYGRGRQPVNDEVDVYTWRDASLRELSDLIKEVNLECRRRDAKFSFHLIYHDYRGHFHSKPLGTVSNSRPGRDDSKTLDELRFVQGDFIDVAIGFGAEMLPPPEGTKMDPSFKYSNRQPYGRSYRDSDRHRNRRQYSK